MNSVQLFDSRRDLYIASKAHEAISYSVTHFIQTARKSLDDHGYFAVALSGGSTPKEIYRSLSATQKDAIDWTKVLLFFSDERAVSPEDKESNYRMAMESGIRDLPIPPDQIFRMVGEGDIEANAKAYEELIKTKIPLKHFDLTMLGMGEDGHTASLFPKTHGLHADGRLVVANFIPSKDIWRMTLTFDCINESHSIALYVLGKSKQEMLKTVLLGPYLPDEYPAQRVGTPKHKALWITDKETAGTGIY